MIISAVICGGLGNQMFCYAAARALALRLHGKVVLDSTTRYRHDRYGRKFILDKLPVTARTASSKESFSGFFGGLQRRSLRLRDRFLPTQRRHFLYEADPFTIDERFFRTAPQRWLRMSGYWQSPNYFQNIAPLIRNELTPVACDLNRVAATPCAEGSIALCLRFYQEVVGPSFHEVIPWQWYERALDQARHRVGNTPVLVFSNDQQRAAQVIGNRLGFYLVPPATGGDDPIADLAQIMRCRHFIIANSSFHWWAAWLGERPNSLVIAPKGRFPNQQCIPSHWLSI